MSTAAGGQTFTFKSFSPLVAPDDPHAAAHTMVIKWVDEVASETKARSWYRSAELKAFPSGQEILAAKPPEARRIVLATVEQLRHWDSELDRVRQQAKSDAERVNAHGLPGWNDVWMRRSAAADVLHALMRRSLPFDADDLVSLLDWCASLRRLDSYVVPLSAFTRTAQRFLATNDTTAELRESLRRLAVRLSDSRSKDDARLATTLRQLSGDSAGEDESSANAESDVPQAERLPIVAASAGRRGVLQPLKRAIGLAVPADPDSATETIGPDEFALRADSPLREYHVQLSNLFSELSARRDYHNPALDKGPVGQSILGLAPAIRGQVLLAAAERSNALEGRGYDAEHPQIWHAMYAASGTVAALLDGDFSIDREGLFDLLLFIAGRKQFDRSAHRKTIERLIGQAENEAQAAPLTDGERYTLHLLRTFLVRSPLLGDMPEDAMRLTRMIGDGLRIFLAPGEVWADAVNDEFTLLDADRRAQWVELFKHALTASAARPSDKWLKTAAKLMNVIGAASIAKSLERWLPLVAKGKTVQMDGAPGGMRSSNVDVMNDQNATILRGLLWMMPGLKRAEMIRLITGVALTAYKKVPGVGPRAVKVGNAAVYALSQISTEEAVGQLALLKVKVKFGTAQKEIEKAFNHAAEALGLPRDQIEEMGVPTYGLEDVGHRREVFGDFAADLTVDGRDAAITWSRVSDGKPQKSVPAKVKSEHKDDLKELQQSCKDIAAMLPAQAERIDAMFLLEKRWPIEQWRERYLDHALIGTIARRLIWVIGNGDEKEQVSAVWHDGKLVDAADRPVEPAPESSIQLWHPIARPLEEVLAWRAWLEQHQVRQPFKQAHREVYLLTDAERNTRVYSNRFAAHVVRQHQFHALCAARGWRNRLRLMVDDVYPPASKDLPTFNLRAEYWIEGIGDNYGTDTTESGAYVRLATDQVRFYRTTAAPNLAHAGGGGYTSNAHGPGAANVNEPVPLEEIPPLALNEVMRDVDLFVGVASVGNDPAWQDGGPDGRYRDYWHSYSFGELGATAQTRRDVLAGLIPRLKIRDRASLSDRFLVVRGNLRTYKIHLGSGNILMEPNDQYLCIVANRSAAGGGAPGPGDVFLPFEGDQTLSVIISKAFMLAADDKITDSTITRQIKM